MARGSSPESPGRRVRMIFLVYCIASSGQIVGNAGERRSSSVLGNAVPLAYTTAVGASVVR